MISILKKINKLLVATSFFLLLAPVAVFAQESLTLSVSPTLFEMTANPGQEWKSSVRVINSNNYDIRVYVDVTNFEAQGETGQVKFLPLFKEESTGNTLAEWIDYDKNEIVIPAEKTISVPFTIKVPENADPGGHFSAILIGTKSLDRGTKQTIVETSQVVTSLVFLRVTGDVDEQGVIREFRSAKTIAEKPEMSFDLRFENKGNVQILPQGEIKILNMWGQERGVIPVNRQTMFGNILPQQIRKYSFTWTGEWSLADMGRYQAIATLAYGNDSRQFATSETAFWVIPWKIMSVVLIILFGFVSAVSWAIKLYIRKMLTMAGVSADAPIARQYASRHSTRKVSVVAPIEEGILDLRHRFRNSVTLIDKLSSVFTFIKQYRIFFAVSLAVIIFVGMIIWYAESASVDKRAYEVTIEGVNESVTVSSEQIEYEAKKEERIATTIQQMSVPPLIIINQSGTNGLAAELSLQLEASGYQIADLSNEFDVKRDSTVIVYNPEFADEALELSRLIDNSLLSAYAEAPTETPITIYVGKDFESEVQ